MRKNLNFQPTHRHFKACASVSASGEQLLLFSLAILFHFFT